MREDEWDRVLATNLKGAMLCTQKALPLLERARGGKVVNIASVEMFRHSRKLSAYAASKGARPACREASPSSWRPVRST